MKTKLFVLALAACVCAALQAAVSAAPAPPDQTIRLMRHPDINQGRIVFSYQNDLWLVPEEGGAARRITTHIGVEDYPKFSPDGKWIAFSGDYNETDGAVFVMPAEGGAPVQLTYELGEGVPVAWTPDGKDVVFYSRRESFSRFFSKLFRVPMSGGLPVEIDMGMASFASFSPDAKRVAYNRHPSMFWWWKRYKGSMNQDVWIHDFAKGTFDRITNYEGDDTWPMWAGDKIYYVSDRGNGVTNIFVQEIGAGEARQVTNFDGRGVTWPSMSSDGKRIAFEREARLYVLDTEGERAREVVVQAPVGDQINMVSYISPLEYVRSFDISPKGKRIVFEARGEVFTAPAEHGDVRNLTASSGARDSDPAWSPDGKWVAYVSDKSGDEEIYLIDQMGKTKEKKITSTGNFKGGVVWSPKSDRLLYTSEDCALYMVDLGGSIVQIAKNEHRDIQSYSWSPDGKWVAYDFAQKNRNRDIFIYDVAKRESRQITFELGDDYEPTFTPDGKYLLLVTDRIGGTPLLTRLSLLPEEKLPFEFKDDEEIAGAVDDDEEKEDNGEEDEENGDADKKPGKAAKEKKKKEPVDVKIDFTDMEKRIRRVPKTIPNPLNVQATDKYYYYMIQQPVMFFGPKYDLYAFDIKEMKSDKVVPGVVSYGISADKQKFVVYADGAFSIYKVGKKAGAGAKAAAADSDSGEKKTGKLDISSKTRMKLDRTAEWKQILDEGWRVVKYHFYDPNLHGVDWNEVKKYYESLLPYVSTRRELNLLMTEMVGELNASHQGVSDGDFGIEAPRASVASLGARIALDEKTGYPRFEKIYKGSNISIRERSPLDEGFIKVKPGDYLLAINGQKLEPRENFHRHLVDQTHNKITITTNDKPTLEGAKETTFMPLGSDAGLQYKDWVDGNETFTDKESGGRIGYMHLPDMMGAGWREFQENFEKYRYKDAIIIDVRFNGGGNIDERIIDYLERRPYQITKTRDESEMERPSQGYYGDIVVLMNQFSFSDAEVFPSAVKQRGLGTLIGVKTLGYVIAVSSHRLIDNGAIRKTHTGIWEIDTGKQLESDGVEPDIVVESPPEMEVQGRDVQLEKAIEFLKEKVKDKDRAKKLDTPIEKR